MVPIKRCPVYTSLNSPEFSRHLQVSVPAVFRTRRATASRPFRHSSHTSTNQARNISPAIRCLGDITHQPSIWIFKRLGRLSSSARVCCLRSWKWDLQSDNNNKDYHHHLSSILRWSLFRCSDLIYPTVRILGWNLTVFHIRWLISICLRMIFLNFGRKVSTHLATTE